MESTMDAKTEKGSDILKQETEKKNESGDQSQDNVKETENKNVGEAVGEVASVGDHHDPPCPVVVEEGTPLDPHSDSVTVETRTKEDVKEPENSNPGEAVREVASVGKHHDFPCPMVLGDCTLPYSDSLTIETRSKDDGPPKTDNETNQVDKNTQLENSSRLKSPSSVALDHDKGLANPTMGTVVEQTEVSTQVSSDISKDGVDFAIVSRDTRVANDETVVKPDSKPREDEESVEQDAKMLIEVDKDPFMPDTQTMKENDNMIVEAGIVNSAYNGIGLVDEHQQATTDHGKGSDVLGSETISNHGNEPFKPDMGTSRNATKGPDLPVTNTLTNGDKRPDVLAAGASDDLEKELTGVPATHTSSDHDKEISTQEAEPKKDVKDEIPDSEVVVDASLDSIVYEDVTVEPASDVEMKDNSVASQGKDGDSEDGTVKHDNSEHAILCVASSDVKSTDERQGDLNNGIHKIESVPPTSDGTINSKHSFLLDDMSEGNESGSEEDQSAFMKELDNFFRERNLEFKPPKFYGEGLNCLKLWRAVTRLGGYDKVTACKLWRQVGESFRPPKTCTTVSWTFRGFYEKALLEYERHKVNGGELQIPLASNSEPMNIDNQVSGSGRARRDAAARAMQGWHSQRLIGNGEVSDPIIKDKSSVPQQKREKQIGTPGLLKRKRPMSSEHGAKSAHTQASKPLLDVTVVDVGPPADWVKINVQRTKDCFEVYALVPGLLREEVRVQSDPAGRLVISGEPENPDNLWGATPFKKVLSLPTRIDPHHTSAVVTLNGQLFVRAPLEQSD